MLISSQKSVLYLTDDALYLYKVSGKSVALKEMFDWSQEDLPDVLPASLKKLGSSVIILNDTVDQHYRKENVPKVGAFDAAAVVKRRLAMAFPEYPIRAFKKLDAGSSDKDNGRAMGHYLFCACPDNGHIRIVLSAIRESGVAIDGLSLLPMESEGVVTKLSEAIAKKKKIFIGKKKAPPSKENDWVIFMGQNASGGLRQIVVKNGQLALTRISPIVETDADLSFWCRDVQRELLATMGYLSRFGYGSDDKLNILIIGDEAAAPILEEIIDFEASIDVVTLDQAMKMLGMSTISGGVKHVASAMHVGWVARKAKLSAPMNSGLIDSIIKPRKTATAVATILVLGLIGSIYYFSQPFINLNKHTRNYEVAETQKKQVDIVYSKEIERKEALGINVKLIQSSFETHKKLMDKQFDPLEIFGDIGRSMGGTLKLDSIEMNVPEPVVDQYGYAPPPAPGQENIVPSTTVLKFSFPGNIDVEKGNEQVLAFGARLQDVFSDAKVNVTKILKDVSYRGELDSEVGLTAIRKTVEELEAEIVIQYGGVQ